MPLMYAAPFILLSLIALLTCLVIPRLRRFAFRALVAPVAFGFFSSVGMLVFVLTSDYLHVRFNITLPFDAPMVGLRGLLAGAVIYFAPGIAGAWLAVWVTGRVKGPQRG